MRREDRVPVDEAARLHPNTWSSVEVRVLDLSRNGFKAEADARVPVGSCVILELPGIGRAYAYVSWCREGRFGARFATAIDLAQCDWSALPDDKVLARLLVERASARQEGHFGQELEFRRKILAGLPMRRGNEASDS